VKRRWWLAIFLAAVALLLLGLWLARTIIAVHFARSYFQEHGVTSSVEIDELGFAGVSARFALGPAETPEISAKRIELHFDPLRWMPYVTEVRLVDPVVRVRVDESGKPDFGSLQAWIDSLSRQQSKSDYVSDDLAVSLRGLRVFLATPAGAIQLAGDVALRKNLPVTINLQAQPAHLLYRDLNADLASASLVYDSKLAHLAAHFSGAVKTPSAQAQGLDVKVEASGLHWTAADNRWSVTAPAATLHATANSLLAGQAFASPQLDVSAHNLSVTMGERLEAQADLSVSGAGGFDATLDALRAVDPPLGEAVRQNLKRLSLNFAGHAERRDGIFKFSLSQPLLMTGAKGASLRVPALSLSGGPDSMNAAAEASIGGPGLPPVNLSLRNLVWSGGGFTSQAVFSSRFNFAMLHGTDLAGQGTFSWQNGQYAFTPVGCVRAALAAFHPGASDLARNVKGEICSLPHQPLLTGEGIGWTLTGEARNASADLLLAAAHVENVVARLNFDGEGAPMKGTATVIASDLSDRAPSLRFKPLTATGVAGLDKGVWSGRFAMAGPKKAELGEATFTHTMATGTGTAHINAPHMTFAPDKLQPDDLSPLLVAVRRAEGSAALTGDIDWTREGFTSRGKLTVASLDFMTPLGKAHAVKSEIALTSLLPPVTAPGQSLTISRIDWTLPFSAVSVRFGFSPTTVQLDKADTDIAEGHASLGAITLSLLNPGPISGAADIKGISLNSLVTASNLGSKVKLEGKVSGHIPFAVAPDGFRITNGHVAADGPGRLSVDRSLWTQGEAAINSNAVQDFAYQALENLAFEQMSAELNSVANGRLQIVFHIKGRSDPPKPQTANVAVTDIINGTALYKPIPLPSGTPIDLTLDTSLNFDELLKSYAEAWSKSLNPEGQPGSVAGGVKP